MLLLQLSRKSCLGTIASVLKGEKRPVRLPGPNNFTALPTAIRIMYLSQRMNLMSFFMGVKKITFPDMNTINNSHFRSVVMDNFPSLRQSGGFDFLRCVPNTKHLEPFSEVAQRNPRVLQERSQKGKVFVRPLQKDLLTSASKRPHVCRSVCV